MENSHRSIEIKIVSIGNSRGVRLPKATLAKYAIGDTVVLEERDEGVLLRNKRDPRLTWEETFKETSQEKEDWSDLEPTAADGLGKDSW